MRSVVTHWELVGINGLKRLAMSPRSVFGGSGEKLVAVGSEYEAVFGMSVEGVDGDTHGHGWTEVNAKARGAASLMTVVTQPWTCLHRLDHRVLFPFVDPTVSTRRDLKLEAPHLPDPSSS